jgi:hypothetical protein
VRDSRVQLCRDEFAVLLTAGPCSALAAESKFRLVACS